jgi:hypothetical protein
MQFETEIQALNELFESEQDNLLPQLSMESLKIKQEFRLNNMNNVLQKTLVEYNDAIAIV